MTRLSRRSVLACAADGWVLMAGHATRPAERYPQRIRCADRDAVAEPGGRSSRGAPAGREPWSAPSRLDRRPPAPLGARAGLPGAGRHPAAGDRVLLNVIGPASAAWAPAAWRWSSPCPDRLPADPPRRAWATSSRPATPRCSRWSSASTSRTARTTTPLRDADDLGRDAGRRRRPALRPAGGAGRAPGGAPAGAGGLRHDRRRRAAAGLLPHGGRAGATPGGSPRRVTVGQAFGGDHEAVTSHTGLLAAPARRGGRRRRGRPGPGQPRHRHPLGLLRGRQRRRGCNAADVLGGRAVASLRVSEADRRERHRGVSHHSLTAYGRAPWRRPTCRCHGCWPATPGARRPGARPAGRRLVERRRGRP